MITVKPVSNAKELEKVFDNPAVKPLIGDDYTKDLKVKRELSDRALHLGVYDNDEIIGIFTAIQVHSLIYEAHSAFLPEYWGTKKTIAGAKEAIKWVKINTAAKKIVGQTPMVNKAALIYNIRLGFDIDGVNKCAIMIDGKLQDLVYFGMRI